VDFVTPCSGQMEIRCFVFPVGQKVVDVLFNRSVRGYVFLFLLLSITLPFFCLFALEGEKVSLEPWNWSCSFYGVFTAFQVKATTLE